ncbi:MAG: GIY-YIG nuclease family protein [Nitrospirota bacterium]
MAGAQGVYLLVLKVPGETIRVGALGRLSFAPGLYGYVGSARGRSATLGHRLARHLRLDKARRWHLDHLTSHPRVQPVAAFLSEGDKLTERRLARLCTARFPAIPRFGNSDQRGKTPGHLFLLRPDR